MLVLSELQMTQLQARDLRQFVVTVCDQFLSERPDVLKRPGRSVVLSRMQAAHDFAGRLNFTSTPHMVELMYLSADAPMLYSDPVIENYLRKRGATPEQRLDDLMAVVKNKAGEKNPWQP